MLQLEKYPGIVGSCMIGIRFQGGVAIAADTGALLGKKIWADDVDRVFAPSDNIIMGLGGAMADNMKILGLTKDIIHKDASFGDGGIMTADNIQHFLRRMLYDFHKERRTILVETMIGGIDKDNNPVLCLVDGVGNCIKKDILASSFGYKLIEGELEKQLKEGYIPTKTETRELIHNCFKLLYYRDSQKIETYKIAICEEGKSCVQGPYRVNDDWSFIEESKGH